MIESLLFFNDGTCYLRGKLHLSSPNLRYIIKSKKLNFLFHHSVELVPKRNFFCLRMFLVELNRATMRCGFWRGIDRVRFPCNAFVFRHCCIGWMKTNTPNDEYENIVNAHMEAAAECIPTIESQMSSSMGVTSSLEKRDNVKIASLWNKRNPINANAEKFKKAQRTQTHNKINKNTVKVRSIN